MEVLVLVKQVPATETAVEINDDGVSIKKESLNWVINPYDEIAVEEALRIKAAHGGSVTIMTVGAKKSEDVIRTAYAMGADQGIRIDDPSIDTRDALGTARIIAAAIKDVPFDLIVAGQRAVDDDNYQVGSAVAEFANIPIVSMVVKQDIIDGEIVCQKTIDGGTAKIAAKLPALITTQRGLNEPRYTSLPGIMKAKKKSIQTKALPDIGMDENAFGAPKVKILKMQFPPQRKDGRIIEGGSVKEKVQELVSALQEETDVL